MELCSKLCASLDGRVVWGRMDTCICMAESLPYIFETTATLLISYTPAENVFGVKKIIILLKNQKRVAPTLQLEKAKMIQCSQKIK